MILKALCLAMVIAVSIACDFLGPWDMVPSVSYFKAPARYWGSTNGRNGVICCLCCGGERTTPVSDSKLTGPRALCMCDDMDYCPELRVSFKFVRERVIVKCNKMHIQNRSLVVL